MINILFNSNTNYLGNINGNLVLQIDNIKNSLINNGVINFSIKDKIIKLEKSKFEIQDIGNIQSEFRYFVDNGDLIFLSENIFELKNKKEFSRKFQIASKSVRNINRIYFDFEKNIDNEEMAISNIHFNKINKENFSEEYYIIKNLQILKGLIRELLI
mgnify:CR=1 FL=1